MEHYNIPVPSIDFLPCLLCPFCLPSLKSLAAVRTRTNEKSFIGLSSHCILYLVSRVLGVMVITFRTRRIPSHCITANETKSPRQSGIYIPNSTQIPNTRHKFLTRPVFPKSPPSFQVLNPSLGSLTFSSHLGCLPSLLIALPSSSQLVSRLAK